MILIITEHEDNAFKPITAELTAFAQRLGRDLDQPVAAVVVGHDVAAVAASLKETQLDRVVVIDDERLADYSPDGYLAAMKPLVEKRKPFLVLAGHTTLGNDLVPRLAANLRRPMVSGCVDYAKQGERFFLIREIFNAKMNMRVSLRGDPPFFATALPGAFSGDDVEAGSSGEAEVFEVDLSRSRIRQKVVKREEASKGEVDLASASTIVSGGRGLKAKEGFGVIFELADALGGAVGASRPVVDAEWLPREHQIGSSGADGFTETLLCDRDFRCDPTPGRDAEFRVHRGHQQRRRRPDFQDCALRDCRGPFQGRSGDHKDREGTQGVGSSGGEAFGAWAEWPVP